MTGTRDNTWHARDEHQSWVFFSSREDERRRLGAAALTCVEIRSLSGEERLLVGPSVRGILISDHERREGEEEEKRKGAGERRGGG